MGCYVNPPSESKEAFLKREGKVVTATEAAMFYESFRTKGAFPVVLVNSGPFTAAAVAYTEAELTEFLDASDTRPKTIYVIETAKLIPVSSLLSQYKEYLTEAELAR